MIFFKKGVRIKTNKFKFLLPNGPSQRRIESYAIANCIIENGVGRMRIRRRSRSEENDGRCLVCGACPCICMPKRICSRCKVSPCVCHASNINHNHNYIHIEGLVAQERDCQISEKEQQKDNKDYVVCQKLCGNISLNHRVEAVEIWKKNEKHKVTATLSIFNSHLSTETITVYVTRTNGEQVTLAVPSGNTQSILVSSVESIVVTRPAQHTAEGKFSIELCFSLRDRKSCD